MAKTKKLPHIKVLVEGETELNYWRSMDFLGTIKLINLWDTKPEKFKKFLIGVRHDEQIIVIADTDVLSQSNNFIQNVCIIKEHCKLTPIILLQIYNFEDELCYASTCKIKDLLSLFDVIGVDKLKNGLANEKQLARKLDKIGHNRDLMWQRSNNNIPNVLSSIRSMIKNNQILVDYKRELK